MTKKNARKDAGKNVTTDARMNVRIDVKYNIRKNARQNARENATIEYQNRKSDAMPEKNVRKNKISYILPDEMFETMTLFCHGGGHSK